MHIQGWLDRVDEIVGRGEAAYTSPTPWSRRRNSLMMKIGEAANRLAKMDVLEPDGMQ